MSLQAARMRALFALLARRLLGGGFLSADSWSWKGNCVELRGIQLSARREAHHSALCVASLFVRRLQLRLVVPWRRLLAEGLSALKATEVQVEVCGLSVLLAEAELRALQKGAAAAKASRQKDLSELSPGGFFSASSLRRMAGFLMRVFVRSAQIFLADKGRWPGTLLKGLSKTAGAFAVARLLPSLRLSASDVAVVLESLSARSHWALCSREKDAERRRVSAKEAAAEGAGERPCDVPSKGLFLPQPFQVRLLVERLRLDTTSPKTQTHTHTQRALLDSAGCTDSSSRGEAAEVEIREGENPSLKEAHLEIRRRASSFGCVRDAQNRRRSSEIAASARRSASSPSASSLEASSLEASSLKTASSSALRRGPAEETAASEAAREAQVFLGGEALEFGRDEERGELRKDPKKNPLPSETRASSVVDAGSALCIKGLFLCWSSECWNLFSLAGCALNHASLSERESEMIPCEDMSGRRCSAGGLG